MIIPFVIPEEIEIGDFNLKNYDPSDFDLSKYGKFYLDDTQLNFSKEIINVDTIRNRILVYHKGESFNLNEIIEGKLSGRTINLNDSINVLIKLDEDSLKKFVKGAHYFKIESDLVSNLIIHFELDETNINVRFDPENF
ncbi:MAG: hypothetical protein JSV62_04595 [Promethearchaeota archaeon]|nr:MAG: hypothetical protein JSV62_04595 [Candidatus Lokiarchaeota archaeon]